MIKNWVMYDKLENYGDETFKIGSLELPYYRGWKGNRESTSERAIEISLGNWFIDKYKENIVEIGAVMPYYYDNYKFDCVDPYDNFPGCFKVDGIDFDYSGKNFLSISSIEHIGWDVGYDKERDKEKAFKVLKKIIKEAENYLITWPMGQNICLDQYLKESRDISYTLMTRDNFRGLINNWTENKSMKGFEIPYLWWDFKLDYYGNAGCVVIVNNCL